MGFTQGIFDLSRRFASGKQKSQVLNALGQRHHFLPQRDGDGQPVYPRNIPSRLLTVNSAQNPAARNGKHHDAGGNVLAFVVPYGSPGSVHQKQFFQRQA